MNLNIIYEDNDVLALDKPPDILVDQVKAIGKLLPEDRSKTIAGWLEIHKPGALLVHRLDKDTSGIILAAKSSAAFDYFKQLFRDRTIKKTYLALVDGVVKKRTGVIEAAIGIKSGMTRHTIHKPKDEREAITEYRVRGHYSLEGKDYTLLEVSPKTGRTHQIRVHLNSIHHPVIGDQLYGNKGGDISARQMLHAHSVEFTHPHGGRMRLEAELPEDFQQVLDKLQKIS